jgi:tRNA(Ile)-lysidine synthase TilS/MesJ
MNKADKRFLEKIRMKTAKAVEDFGLIEPGDKILVAVSGGKDSMVLLDALHNRKNYFDFSYTIHAANIELTDVGYKIEKERIRKFCRDRNIPVTFISDDSRIVDGRKHPCFYCAWTRRKLLFEYAYEKGFNKVAFGHNADDLAETLLMNMIYHAELSAFPAILPMFEEKLFIIRPLLYVTNQEANRYVQIMNYEPVPYNCPYAGGNDREKFRKLTSYLQSIHRHAVENILHSVMNINREYLPGTIKSTPPR